MDCKCSRIVVQDELSKFGVTVLSLRQGEVELSSELSFTQFAIFSDRLQRFGLELITNRHTILIERIKNILLEGIYAEQTSPNRFSVLLAEELGYDYPYLAGVFSKVTGNTIEQFFISHRIARAKELLLSEGTTLTEIAHKLQYSSVAHLANQFKKVTGCTASHFRSINMGRLNWVKKNNADIIRSESLLGS